MIQSTEQPITGRRTQRRRNLIIGAAAAVIAVTATVIVIATTSGSSSRFGALVGSCNIGPGAQCPGANLSFANLTSADLSFANLTSADLTGANFYGADLYRANLTGTYLHHLDGFFPEKAGPYLIGTYSGILGQPASPLPAGWTFTGMPGTLTLIPPSPSMSLK